MQSYMWAGSETKFLRFITGRHDLPFYYKEEVEIQRSFLNAFLKGQDDAGWPTGKVSPVSVCLRKGDVGYNNPKGEKTFGRREENEWPIARTQYTNYFLTSEGAVNEGEPSQDESQLSYEALGTSENPRLVQFTTLPFDQETEITGHIVAHLNISMTSAEANLSLNKDIDVFLMLRHISPAGVEVFYTGSSGDNVPLTKGWLRVSLRKINPDHPWHRYYLPYREYLSTDILPVKEGETYGIDIEMWPTNVVVEKRGKLIFEASSILKVVVSSNIPLKWTGMVFVTSTLCYPVLMLRIDHSQFSGDELHSVRA